MHMQVLENTGSMSAHQSVDPYLNEVTSILKNEFKPKRIFLFGSRANGNAHPDSDYDFVLVVDSTRKARIENMIRGKELIRHLHISIDVFVYTEGEFIENENEFNSIPEIALHTGMEIDVSKF